MATITGTTLVQYDCSDGALPRFKTLMWGMCFILPYGSAPTVFIAYAYKILQMNIFFDFMTLFFNYSQTYYFISEKKIDKETCGTG